MSTPRNHHRRPRPARTPSRRSAPPRSAVTTRPPGIAPTPDGTRLDAALEMMAGLDDDTVMFLHADGPHRSRLGLRELVSDPRCAGAGMFGMQAPMGVDLVGCCFRGRPGAASVAASIAAEPVAWPVEDSDGRGCRVEVVVAADGRIDARVHHDDGRLTLTAAPSGIVVDALHRLIGLPVPGAPPPLTSLVAGMWMAQVLRLPLLTPGPAWAEVAAVHPGATPDGDPSGAPSPQRVAASMHRLAQEASWEDLHHAASVGRMPAPELDASEAAWMDTTMFARWMTDSFPPPADALAVLAGMGATDAVRGVEAVLAHLGGLG